jgi:glycerophosphoryl diester phosphodiesterase
VSLDRPDSWRYPSLVAHRCGGTLAPENTLAGLTLAVRHHVGMVEFDAKLSADNVPFLLHDDDVDRTSNGRGAAVTMSYSEIAALDAGSWFAAEFAQERMPMLESVARRCIELGLCANVEIKPCAGRDEVTGELVARAVARLWKDAPVPPLLSSFSEEALAAAQTSAPALPRGLLFGKLPHDWLARVKRLDCVSVHFEHTPIGREQVESIRSEGLRTLAYTVNDASRARTLRAWGVDAICTDRIDTVT